MSDSVDRVFSHALNTVNKIRTGSQKPPSATRLKLYGLYKQAMEGDVDGIMDAPQGSGDAEQKAREKWDAWKQQNRLSRTEAKRRYITTLIETMHKYASPSADSRELVAELEFVWDQVKSNVPSSSSSSPLQTLSQVGMHIAPTQPQFNDLGRLEDTQRCNDFDGARQRSLRLKSPMSQSDEELEDDEADLDRDEFVDAPDSQDEPADDQANPPQTPTPAPRIRSILPRSIPVPEFPSSAPNRPDPSSSTDQQWRKRMEQAVVKMTAEIAALREQLEARRLFSHAPHHRVLRAAWRFACAAVRHVAVNVFILGIVLLWMRRKKDKRLEKVVRVVLGDAVSQVQRASGVKLGKVKVLGLQKKE